MTNIDKRKSIIDGLELVDINNPPAGVIYYIPEIDFKDCEFDLDEHRNWEKIKQQPPVLIYDNPSGFTPEEIISYFAAIQENSKNSDGINIDYCSTDRFGLSDDKKSANYLLVAFSKDNPKNPIGFTNFSISIYAYTDDPEYDYSRFGLCIDYILDYVSPEFRGLAYGFALATKRANVYIEQTNHLFEKLDGTDIVLEPLAESDWVSFGGEKLTKVSNGEIEAFIEELLEYSDDKKTINIKKLEFDGGV